jgi:hypothetical protein
MEARRTEQDLIGVLKKGRNKELDAKALMVIGSLCPISVEGVIKGLRWGIGPEGGKAFSSHHIWTFIPPACPFVEQNWGGGGYGRPDGRMDGRTDRWTDGWTDGRMDGMNVHM